MHRTFSNLMALSATCYVASFAASYLSGIPLKPTLLESKLLPIATTVAHKIVGTIYQATGSPELAAAGLLGAGTAGAGVIAWLMTRVTLKGCDTIGDFLARVDQGRPAKP